MSAGNAYPSTDPTTPANLRNVPNPLYVGTGADSSIATELTTLPHPASDTGGAYDGVYQIRFITFGPTTGTDTLYWRAAIKVSGTTWTQTWCPPPAPSTSTTLTAAPASPQTAGTTLNLTASVIPTAAVGSVQFQSDGANLGPAVSVTAGTATTSTNSLGAGTHNLTAVFTPTDPTAFGASTSQPVRYVINPAPVPFSIVTTSPLPAGTVNSPYSATLAATGGTSPSTWALATGTLPPGLTLSSAGVISGTPTAPVTSTFTVRVTDSTTPTAQTATGAFAITVMSSSPATAVKGLTLTNPALGGYWLVASDGGVFGLGNTGFFGSAGSLALRKPIVGVVATPDRKGYWLVASDGGVFAFGNTGFYGSAASLRLSKPIVGMAPTPDGKGYWLVASDGGVFTYGDAGFFGSAGTLRLSKPIVGMAPTPDGKGYWLVASDGGVFTYGDAGFFGSAASLRLSKPIVGIAGG
jgi:hypothetical protein